MSYIDVRFTSTEKGSEWDQYGLFTAPLKEQFSKLKNRYAALGTYGGVADLATACFPSVNHHYHMSLPNFERSYEEKNGRHTLNNVVIRTIPSPSFSRIYQINFLFIGNIVFFGPYTYFEVKGIEVIDEGTRGVGEMEFDCQSYLKFPDTALNRATMFPSDNLLSRDFVDELRNRFFTISNPDVIKQTIDKWERYLDFVMDYLGKQKKNHYEIGEIRLLDAYAVTKQEFIEKRDLCEPAVLDKDISDRFRKYDEIILDRKIGNAVEFPLIRIAVDRLEKDFKNGKERELTAHDKALSRFTNENVCVTSEPPISLDEKTYSMLVNKSLHLGDRYAIISRVRIEPDYADIESDIKNKADKAALDINERYSSAAKAQAEADAKRFMEEAAEETTAKIAEYASRIDPDDVDRVKKITSFENRMRQEDEKQRKALLGRKQTEYEAASREEKDAQIAARVDALHAEETALKQQRKDDQTKLRNYVYFKLDDPDHPPLVEEGLRYLLYDDTASKRKVQRTRDALKQFYRGNVKNPYMANYLFDPGSLMPSADFDDDLPWFITRLNKEQKEAVRRAYHSNGLFLMQGPPGTGKTEVIAEMAAQFTRVGKKVLIASETHKAIDNVFKRLPKSAHIRPIRLTTYRVQKDQEFGPKKLVDNFYASISSNMKDALRDQERFAQEDAMFDADVMEVKRSVGEYRRLETEYKHFSELQETRQTKMQSLAVDFAGLDRARKELQESKALLLNTRQSIQDVRMRDSDLDASVDVERIQSCLGEMIATLENDKAFNTTIDSMFMIIATSPDVIESQIGKLLPQSQQMYFAKLEQTKIAEELMNYLSKPGSASATMEDLQRRYQELSKHAEGTSTKSELVIQKVFKGDYLANQANHPGIKARFDAMRKALLDTKRKHVEKLDVDIDAQKKKLESNDAQIKENRLSYAEMERAQNDSGINPNVIAYETTERKIKTEIERLYLTTNTPLNYESFEEAIVRLESEWRKNRTARKKKLRELEAYRPMFSKIVRYLANDDVIDQDRIKFTKPLFEAGNLFGITCTSNDRFNSTNNDDLKSLGLDEINIRRVGIDVVIIDEVSKSSFLELMIPILYGKTVILVGDHRQLPPLYEYKYLRDSDFEDLNPAISTPELNREYQRMYETSFFKTLFEKTNKSFKITLLKQYRSHEQIMNVFNHFYQGQLQLGKEGQNLEKEHHIRIVQRGMNLITPDKHIYFVDCREKESSDFTETTSCSNMTEAEVAVKLARLIETNLKKINQDNPSVPKLSIGVICTYGDQAKIIKKKAQWIYNSPAFDLSPEQRPIISTVDDFQGDERDIIIVSMVRNPRDPSKSKAEFIKAFERINVAFSRARRLLVILGSREYLTLHGKIELPDMNGDARKDKHDYPIFQHIINTILEQGKVLCDTDFLKTEEPVNGKR